MTALYLLPWASLVVGQPVTRATMVNAVTAVAHKADADSVDDWQRLGGRVLDFTPLRLATRRDGRLTEHPQSVPRSGGVFLPAVCDRLGA